MVTLINGGIRGISTCPMRIDVTFFRRKYTYIGYYPQCTGIVAFHETNPSKHVDVFGRGA